MGVALGQGDAHVGTGHAQVGCGDVQVVRLCQCLAQVFLAEPVSAAGAFKRFKARVQAARSGIGNDGVSNLNVMLVDQVAARNRLVVE